MIDSNQSVTGLEGERSEAEGRGARARARGGTAECIFAAGQSDRQERARSEHCARAAAARRNQRVVIVERKKMKRVCRDDVAHASDLGEGVAPVSLRPR